MTLWKVLLFKATPDVVVFLLSKEIVEYFGNYYILNSDMHFFVFTLIKQNIE